MGISEEKMKIVINNYFKSECDVNTSIREAFEKGFRIGVKKGLAQSKADTPQTDCGDFADRLAYERGVKHAWEVAQKVFDSTVTFYEAEDVAKQIAKTEPTSSKMEQVEDEPQIKQSEEFKQFIGHDCSKCRWSKCGEACTIPCCDFEPKDEPQTER